MKRRLILFPVFALSQCTVPNFLIIFVKHFILSFIDLSQTHTPICDGLQKVLKHSIQNYELEQCTLKVNVKTHDLIYPRDSPNTSTINCY